MRIGQLIRSRKGMLLAVLAVAVVAGVLVFNYFQRQNDDGLRLYGNVDIREVQLAFRQAGRVEIMHFDEGDQVQAGARLAVLDAVPYADALAAADAAVAVAVADLDKLRRGLRPQEVAIAREARRKAEAVAAEAHRNFLRQQELAQSGASSERTLDLARMAHAQAMADVESARAALSQAEEGYRREDVAAAEARLAAARATQAQAATALADTELVAPSTGTILTRLREPGSMVAGQVPVYGLSLDNPVYVRAYVNEPDLGRIAPGMQVQIRTDSSDHVYGGQIGFISPRAEFTPKTVETSDLRTDLVYRLRIVVTDADSGLRQGMPVTIDVDAAEVGNEPRR